MAGLLVSMLLATSCTGPPAPPSATPAPGAASAPNLTAGSVTAASGAVGSATGAAAAVPAVGALLDSLIGTPTAVGRPDIPAEAWAPARAAAVRTLVTERIAALDRGDRAAWLRPVRGSGIRAQQGRIFDRMTAIPVTGLRLLDITEVLGPVPGPAGQRVTWQVRVRLDYGITGYQTAPRSFSLDLSLMADPAEPATVVLTDSQPGDRLQPWDLAGLEVRRSTHVLVLGVGGVGQAVRLDEASRRAETAHARVVARWGSAAPSVVILPGSDEDAARLLGGTPGSLAGVAAVTDGPLAAGRVAGADRIVVVPGPWASLTSTGRDVVLTHEMTHVAVRASTTRAVPLWLSEGFAEYVAYRSVSLPESAIVAPLLEQASIAARLDRLPGPEAFDPASGTMPAAYGMALLAVRTLADTHHQAGLLRLYRAAAGGLAVSSGRSTDPEDIVDDALRATLGTTRDRLETQWRARMAALARS